MRLHLWFGPRSYAALALIAVALGVSPGAHVFFTIAIVAAMLFLGALLVDVMGGPRAGDLSIARHLPSHLALRVPIHVTYDIENRAKHPVRVGIVETPVRTLRDDGAAVVARIPAGSRAGLERTLLPVARGSDELGSLYVWLEGPLGLIRRRTTVDARTPIRVYPDLSAVERYGSLRVRNRLVDAGLRRIRMRGEGTAFESLREYAAGDAFRSVDWKASARRGRLMVAQREVERSQDVVILLDCGRLMTPRIDAQRKLDYAVTAALSLASIASLASDRVGLVAFAREILLARAPRSTVTSVRALADALCDIEPRFEEADYAHAFAYVRAHLHRRSLLVLLTDAVDAVAQSVVVAELASLAKRHLVLCVLMNDAAVERALTAIPATIDDAYRAQAALDLQRERTLSVARLERAGIGVVDVPAGRLSVAAIDAYLRVKQRGLL
ncbi:MAG: DUF58 domain-containing protein [Vulcanimicrobiaceae bacterium]